MDIGYGYEPGEDALFNLLFEKGKVMARMDTDRSFERTEKAYRERHPVRYHSSKISQAITRELSGLLAKFF